MVKKLSMGQIIWDIANDPSPRQKVAKLHYYAKAYGRELKLTLGYLFDTRFEMGLPKGRPPVRGMTMEESRSQSASQAFYDHLGNLTKLVKTARQNWTDSDAENFFNKVYITCSPIDADLLVRMKDRDPPPGLTREVVKAAFPILESSWPQPVSANPAVSAKVETEETGEKRGRGRPKGAKNKVKA
jgi:hypothetical protein